MEKGKDVPDKMDDDNVVLHEEEDERAANISVQISHCSEDTHLGLTSLYIRPCSMEYCKRATTIYRKT